MTRRSLPLVGITADLANAQRKAIKSNAEPLVFLPERYVTAIELAGGTPVVLPSIGSTPALRRYLDALDGVVISGGDFDIHPHHYGERPDKNLGNLIPRRTEFELALAEMALRSDMPLLGICGGAQAINVVLGGSLIQDVSTQIGGAVEHQQSAKKQTGGHRIDVMRGTLLYRILGRPSLEVNTTHHQAIKEPGKGLIVNAVAPDGVIEGIESARHTFVLGVQWHPEILARRQLPHRRLFRSFLASCKRFRRGR